MENKNLLKRIVIDPKIMMGKMIFQRVLSLIKKKGDAINAALLEKINEKRLGFKNILATKFM